MDKKMEKVTKLLRKMIVSNEHAVQFIRDYGDETLIHDRAVKDGFLVVDGRCNDPNCPLCEMEQDTGEAEILLEELIGNINVEKEQLSLLLTT